MRLRLGKTAIDSRPCPDYACAAVGRGAELFLSFVSAGPVLPDADELINVSWRPPDRAAANALSLRGEPRYRLSGRFCSIHSTQPGN